jgi:hypothetical protein
MDNIEKDDFSARPGTNPERSLQMSRLVPAAAITDDRNRALNDPNADGPSA